MKCSGKSLVFLGWFADKESYWNSFSSPFERKLTFFIVDFTPTFIRFRFKSTTLFPQLHFHWYQVSANSIHFRKQQLDKYFTRVFIMDYKFIIASFYHHGRHIYHNIDDCFTIHKQCVCVFFSIGIIIISFIHFKGMPDIKMEKGAFNGFMYQHSPPVPRKKFVRLSFLSVHNKFGGIHVCEYPNTVAFFASVGNRPYLKWRDWDYLNYCFYLKYYLAFMVSIECIFLRTDFCKIGHGYRPCQAHCFNDFDHCDIVKRPKVLKQCNRLVK